MLKVISARLQQGFRTSGYPSVAPTLPPRFRGLPVLRGGDCASSCGLCESVCPTSALKYQDGVGSIDMGRCLFCGECAAACSESKISFSGEYRLSTGSRSDLVVRSTDTKRVGRALKQRVSELFGRSLRLRQVSAGGCNACEADVNVLSTIGFDLGQFGIEFVASPRHADGVLVTGPVTRNMHLALQKTWDATPDPKIVIAVGACAIGGGPYDNKEKTLCGVSSVLPVDLYVPGCPPHPMTILDGLLRLLGRIEDVGDAS